MLLRARPVLVLIAALALSLCMPSSAMAASRYAVRAIDVPAQAKHRAVAVDPVRGTVYVGQQDGADGAEVVMLDQSGRPRGSVRVGDAFDAATNVSDDPEIPAPHAPSDVVSLAINPVTRQLVALVTSTFINTSQTYSHLSGAVVVVVDLRTNAVLKRYTVAKFSGGWPQVDTMWTGMSLDIAHNAVWGVEGYDPTWSNAVDRLDLGTGVQQRTELPVVASDAPIDAVPTIAWSDASRSAYVSVAGTVFVIDRNVRVSETLRLPCTPCADPVSLPGTAPTSIVAADRALYVNFYGSIYAIDVRRNRVSTLFETAQYSRGLAVDLSRRELVTVETRDDVQGLAVYSAVTGEPRGFVPVQTPGDDGNGWITADSLRHKIYVTSSSSVIYEVSKKGR